MELQCPNAVISCTFNIYIEEIASVDKIAEAIVHNTDAPPRNEGLTAEK